MLVTVLTLPWARVKGIPADLRQMSADYGRWMQRQRGSGGEGCNFDAIIIGRLNIAKEGRAGVYQAVESAKWKKL